VVTASTGNHAQSIAYAGSLFGVDVKVLCPKAYPAKNWKPLDRLALK